MEVCTGKALLWSKAPASIAGTLDAASEPQLLALLLKRVVLQEDCVLLRSHDLRPIDTVGKAERFVF